MNFKALHNYKQLRLALRVIGGVGDMSIRILAMHPQYQAELYRVAAHIPPTAEVSTHAVMDQYQRHVNAHDTFFISVIQICAIASALRNRLDKGGDLDREVNQAGVEIQAYIGENYGDWQTVETKNFAHEKLRMDQNLQGLIFQFLMQYVEESK